MLPWTDWLFVDLKQMDAEAHRAGTGAGNELILRNLTTVATAAWPGRLIVRAPVVPGFNDTAENLEATAAFVAELGLAEVNLLPFHRLGASKYEQLGLAYPYAHVPALSGKDLQIPAEIFAAAGLRCYVGDTTPF